MKTGISVTREYRICNRCVMDTSDSEIVFDSQGICNHCREYDRITTRRFFLGEEREQRLAELVSRIKEEGRGKEYDCIIGLSGGVDSSYLAMKAVGLGLRPLAVHLDNGWNSELAVGNIERIVKTLRIDLYTHVIDWEEFRDLQLAFLRASVIDIELLTDHAIAASIYHEATRRRIRYFLSGVNLASESVMPRSWYYPYKLDGLNIRAIWRKHGSGRSLKTFPLLGTYKHFNMILGRTLSTVPFLDYLPYHKDAAKRTLQQEFGWVDYGGKHYESRFTRFYQAYLLPGKFGVDKRRAHLSSLLLSGQITREQGLELLEEPLYRERELAEDKEYVIKKFGLTEGEFERILHLPPRSHLDYHNSSGIMRLLSRVKNFLRSRKEK